MVKKTTQWRPDTCGCKVSYTWETDVPSNERIHTFSAVLNTCPDHPYLDGKALYDVMVDENTRKNIAISIVEKLSPPPSQNGDDGPDPLEQVYWDFDPQRVLLLALPARVNPATSNTALTQMDTKFGVGKVEFVVKLVSNG